jgi:hypothetical protein
MWLVVVVLHQVLVIDARAQGEINGTTQKKSCILDIHPHQAGGRS